MDMAHERTSTEVLYDYLRRSGRLARLGARPRPRQRTRSRALLRDRAQRVPVSCRSTALPASVPHLDALIEAEDELPRPDRWTSMPFPC